MLSNKIPMEEEKIYEHELDLLYQRSNQLKVQSELIIQRVLPKLQKKEGFLDVGAGNGLLTEKVSPFFKETFCIEPHHRDYDLLSKKFNNTYNTDIENFQSNRKFDLILCSHVLYYIKREFWVSEIKKMFQLLTKNGILVIILQSKDGEMQRFFNKFANQIYDIDPDKLNDDLKQTNYKTEIIHLSITIKTTQFDEFLELGYFFLLEKKENLIDKEAQIKEYLMSNFKKNNHYLMKQEIDIILVFKTSINQRF